MNRIVITMDGGLIQHICADRPEDIQLIVVDYDVQGTDEETVRVYFGEGSSAPAVVHVYPVEVGDCWLDIASNLAAMAAGGQPDE